jgi:hypothetical protein
VRAHPFVQGRKADPQIIRNLAPRQPAGQRYPHRFFTKFIRPACAHGSSHLLHNMLSEERHKTAKGPNMSDPQAEDSLYDSAAMRDLVGNDLRNEAAPDETTICKF